MTAGILTSFFRVERSRAISRVFPELPRKSTLPTLSQVGWWSAALEIGKLLYPVLRPFVVQLASHAVQSRLAKRGKPQ